MSDAKAEPREFILFRSSKATKSGARSYWSVREKDYSGVFYGPNSPWLVKETISVIEKSAFDAQAAEIESLKAKLALRKP